MQTAVERQLQHTSSRVRAFLENLLNDKAYPPRLAEAMSYAALDGGKCIRPFLVMEAARLCDADEKIPLPAAAALECIHCYSLIHDDLPSMDDDRLRRGKPTLHVAYDEATAILAGDSLLTLAFEILSGMRTVSPEIKLRLIHELSVAAGAGGMAGGQMLDLAAEGRFADGAPLILNETEILQLQGKKTGALLRYAVRAGALIGAADGPRLQALTRYGENLGLLFQLADDLIDATGSEVLAGKSVAKDLQRGKATLVSILGVEVARRRLQEWAALCEKELVDFDKAENLRTLPQMIIARVL